MARMPDRTIGWALVAGLIAFMWGADALITWLG